MVGAASTLHNCFTDLKVDDKQQTIYQGVIELTSMVSQIELGGQLRIFPMTVVILIETWRFQR